MEEVTLKEISKRIVEALLDGLGGGDFGEDFDKAYADLSNYREDMEATVQATLSGVTVFE